MTEGGMDVGLFAPVDMLNIEVAKGVVAEMKELFEGVVAQE